MGKSLIQRKKKQADIFKARLNDNRQGKTKKLEPTMGEVTAKPMESPLGTAKTSMIHGRVAHNVKSLDAPGTKISKPNKIFSNAIPHGYTRKTWNDRLQKIHKI